MLPYGVSGGSASAAGRVSDGLGGESPSVEKLREETDNALRQLKKLRKVELEKICKAAGMSATGLKATLLSKVESYLGSQFSLVARAGSGTTIEARELMAVMQEINRGYEGIGRKRTAQLGLYSMKEDLGDRANGSARLSSRGDGLSALGSRWDDEAKAEILRRSRLDPFVEVTNTLIGPAKLEKNAGAQARAVMDFNLTEVEMQAVRSSLSQSKSTPEGRKTRVLMRSYKLNEDGSAGSSTGDSSGAGSKSKGSNGGELGAHLWPLESVCHVNGRNQILKQRKVFYQGSTRKLKGDCSPHDIGEACNHGNNHMEIYSSDGDTYTVVVQTVRLVGVQEVLDNVKRRPQLTKEEALRRVKRSFLGLDINDLSDGKDEKALAGGGVYSDDELMATATRLSLRCPVGLVPITCPGRGRYCKHLQCFDLATFLNFNKDCAGAAWKCGVCNLPLQPADLVVDTYLSDVVGSLKEQGLTDEVEEIEIDDGGKWKPIREDQKAGNSRRDRKKMPPPPARSIPVGGTKVSQPIGGGEVIHDSPGGAAADAGGGGSASGGRSSTFSRPGQAVATTQSGSSSSSSNGGGFRSGASGGVVPAERSASAFAPVPAPAPSPSPSPAAEPIVFDLSFDSDDEEQPTGTAGTVATEAAAATRAGAEAGGAGWRVSAAAQRSNVFVRGSSSVIVVGGGSSVINRNSSANSPTASREGQPLVQAARFREAGAQISRGSLEVPPPLPPPPLPLPPQSKSQHSGPLSWGDDSAGHSTGAGGGNVIANGSSTSSSSIFLRDTSSSAQIQTNAADVRRSRSADPGHGGGSSRDRTGAGGGRGVGWVPSGAGGRGRGQQPQRRDLGPASPARQREHGSAPPSWEASSLVSYSTGQAHKPSVGRGGGSGAGGVSIGGGSSRYSSELSRQSYPSDLSSSRKDVSRDGESGSNGSSTQRHDRRTPPPPSSSSLSYNTGGSRSAAVGGGREGFRSCTSVGGSSSSQSHGRGNTGSGATMKDVEDAWASLSRSSVGAATVAPVVGWDNVGPGGGATASLKRPRPSSGRSPDYERREGRVGGRGNRDEGGGGSTSAGSGSGSNGVATMPFMGEFDVFSSCNRGGNGGVGGDTSERGERGRLANKRRYWDESSRSAGRRGGVGSMGGGGLNDAGNGGSVVGWNDEVLRNLDGLGDPIG